MALSILKKVISPEHHYIENTEDQIVGFCISCILEAE